MGKEVLINTSGQRHTDRESDRHLATELADPRDDAIILVSSRYVIQSKNPHFRRPRRVESLFKAGVWMSPVRHLRSLLHIHERRFVKERATAAVDRRIERH